MNSKQVKQTKLVLGALASGAAALNPALSPVRKLGGLAGFCLGLMRTRPGARRQKRSEGMQKGCRKDVRHGAAAKNKGGRHHG